MEKLFCFSVFGRKMKVAKAKSDAKTVQISKGVGDQDGFGGRVNSFEGEFGLTTMEDSQLVIDSPDCCSAVSEGGSRHVASGNSLPGNLQVTEFLEHSLSASPDSPLDVQDQDHVGEEPVALSAETGGSLDDLSCWSLIGQETRLEDASVSVNELASAKGDETQRFFCPHSMKSGDDCVDESEGDFEVSDSESNRQSYEDFTKLSHEITPLSAHPTEHFEVSYQWMPHQGSDSEDGVEPPTDQRVAGYEHIGTVGGAAFQDSPDADHFPSDNSDRIALDDEVLTGHISDPGVYKREELQPNYELPIVGNDSSMVPPLDENGCIAAHKSEFRMMRDAVEKISVDINEHGSSPSELTFCSADRVILKSESYSKVLAQSKRKSWWKIFMISHRNIHREILPPTSDSLQHSEVTEIHLNTSTGYTSDICEVGHRPDRSNIMMDDQILNERTHHTKTASAEQPLAIREEDGTSVLGTGLKDLHGTSVWSSNEWIAFPPAGSSLSRVEEWINNIQQPDLLADGEEMPSKESDAFALENSTLINNEVGDHAATMHQAAGAVTMDAELAHAAARSLNLFSTVAHIAGLGLREVPALGAFNSLKILNLSANCIARVPAGCLPRSLHSLDLSRNRISVIEGFRELIRLRVLNLSYNRISRIGHGLGNCTLIKELYLAGNKIAEVEGLHRLLKLTVLDLSFNKLTTSKALGQLAANYSSLLALNLLGNPVHINVGEEQLRKLVMSITPHVTYFNKQPMKAVSAREAAVDSVARAALGTSQRNSKATSTRALRKVAGTQSTFLQSKSSSHHGKDVEKRRSSLTTGSDSSKSKSARLPRQHHHHHHHNSGQHSEKGLGKEHGHPSRTPLSVHEQLLRKLAMDAGSQGMHRSRSDSALQDQVQSG